MSEDGRTGLVLIAFLGSVFSPYYAMARRRGAARPEEHCALNVALYRSGRRLWAMTERGAGAIERSATAYRIGPSRIAWEGDALTVRIDERTAPWPSRLLGRVRLMPRGLCGQMVPLTAAGNHRWWPIAPLAWVEVTFERPALRFSGHGYLDANEGDGPLEDGFVRWDWSRASDGREAVIFYEGEPRCGAPFLLALRATPDGRLEPVDPPPRQPLAQSRWGLARTTRVDPGHTARIVRSLEDGPFYARSQLATRVLGRELPAIHERLSLDRFARLWVQLLLPFRMPRRVGRPAYRPELPDREGQDPAQDQETFEQYDRPGGHDRISSLRAGKRDG